MVPGPQGIGRIAVVTGANKGIGFAIALQLGLSGIFSRVILGCRNVVRGEEAAEAMNQIAAGKAQFSSFPLVIGDANSHTEFQKRMEAEFGYCDVLVNNAGFAYKSADPTPFEEQTENTLAINYYGLVDFTEKMIPLLRKGTDPRVVNVASRSGRLRQVSRELQEKFADPSLTIEGLNHLVSDFAQSVQDGNHLQKGWSDSNYGISKLAVIAATKVWARQELGRIIVTSCCPGYCKTDMTSQKGPRSPADGARNAVIPATIKSPATGAFYENYDVAKW